MVGPVAGLGALAVGAVAMASVVPPELWAALLTIGSPLLLMALFAFGPIALPVLAFLWLARGPGEPHPPHHGRRHLGPQWPRP